MCGIFGLIRAKHNFSNDDRITAYTSFIKTKHRGPENSCFKEISPKIILGFHRLSIMDPSSDGDQPFVVRDGEKTIYCVCNGEIYNYKKLIKRHDLPDTDNDCKILIPLFQKIGFRAMIAQLDAEFACVILEVTKDETKIYMARDHCGIRPLFYHVTPDKSIEFASELKSCITPSAKQFPPGHSLIYSTAHGNAPSVKKFFGFNDKIPNVTTSSLYLSLVQSVKDRLITDRPIGCLLSGGLDSSLIVSIASRLLKEQGKQLRTFSIGLPGSTDRIYAEKVAEFCNTKHTHIECDEKEFLDAIQDVVYATETYDITTIRASVGQYLIAKWISENTDIKVLLIGDGSDELCSGYLYFHNAPDPEESHNENIRLLSEIHYYDVLRADRGISAHGLEARVPFLSRRFINNVLSFNKDFRFIKNGCIEKSFLRSAFDKCLPDEVLWRKKEAFSDGVSSSQRSWFNIIQDYYDRNRDEYKDECEYEYCQPISEESHIYREMFEDEFGREAAEVIPGYWMPKWCGGVRDPSARVLKVYSMSPAEKA